MRFWSFSSKVKPTTGNSRGLILFKFSRNSFKLAYLTQFLELREKNMMEPMMSLYLCYLLRSTDYKRLVQLMKTTTSENKKNRKNEILIFESHVCFYVCRECCRL